jgi:acyl-CoA dehydrogenase
MAVTGLVDTLLVETVERLLDATATFEVVERAEADGWCATVWDGLAEAGFPWISVPAAAGGSDGTLADAMAVIRSAGRHAAPVPLAETGVLAGWLLAAGGFAVGAGPASVVPDPAALRVRGGRIEGESVVAWAERSSVIAALVQTADGWMIVSARPEQLAITPGRNMAGEPRDTVRWDVSLEDVEHIPAPEGVDGDALRARGALTRVVLMAGAMESIAQRAVDYAHARRQFGRPIASFQAVQHHLVTAAQCRIRASMAADLAVRAMSEGSARFEIAAAKVICDQAATDATRSAHQVHGAMGLTREYPLHHLSRRLWAWRHEYGRARAWRRELGADVVAAGADGLFPLVAR